MVGQHNSPDNVKIKSDEMMQLKDNCYAIYVQKNFWLEVLSAVLVMYIMIFCYLWLQTLKM